MGKPTDDVWSWVKQQVGDKAVLLAAFAAFVGFGMAWARSTVAEAAEDKVAPVRAANAVMAKKQDRYEEDVHELAKDVREIYRVMPSRRMKSERLERPFGDHDGGEE